MSEPGLEAIESSVQKTHEWIAAIAGAAHLGKGDAYKALRAVLQTLRDRLPVDDAAHFSAQLPLFLRGVFFDGWRPADVPKKLSRVDFLQAVSDRIVAKHFIDPARITADVLSVVAAHVSAGEMDKVKGLMPADVQSLWPSPVPA